LFAAPLFIKNNYITLYYITDYFFLQGGFIAFFEFYAVFETPEDALYIAEVPAAMPQGLPLC
jgi:hypothetical protein